jgi:hypothetical protein
MWTPWPIPAISKSLIVLPAPTPSAPPSAVYLTSVEPVSGSGNGWPSAFPRAFTHAARTGFTRDSERGSGWLNKPRENAVAMTTSAGPGMVPRG